MAGVFDVLNTRVSIAGRMRILGVLMVVPVAITGFLLYNTHKANIDFARSELAGANYLGVIWPQMMAGAAGQSAPDGTALGVAAKANSALVDPAKADALAAKSDKDLLTSANALMAEVTDTSKLILDPDLDSFYMMDAVTTKLPALVVAAAAVHENPASEINTVTFDNAVIALKDSFDKSGRYGKAGRLKADTDAALASLIDAAKALRTDPGAYEAFLKAADALFVPGDRDLAAMQKLRADKETTRMIEEFAAAGAVLALALAVAFSIAAGLSSRLKTLSGLMTSLTRGETVTDIPYQQDRHETGAIVSTLLAFRENLAETERMRLVQHRLEEDGINERRKVMISLADHFERSVLAIVDRLSGSAQSLGETAASLDDNAEQTRVRSETVTRAMDAASANVQSVASATEEMAASSNSIADQAERAAMAAGAAAAKAEQTNQRVAAMNDAASRIGSSIEMITQITSQTNLLALNATIEAARAGEAGRGFNVVATEVKALASQTARATEEISQQVRGVQEATAEAADAMIAIAGMVSGLKDISNAISESVSQQTAAVGEISRSTAEVAGTTSEISEDINEVRSRANQTGEKAKAALRDIQHLSEQTQALRETAVEFLGSVRTG